MDQKSSAISHTDGDTNNVEIHTKNLTHTKIHTKCQLKI